MKHRIPKEYTLLVSCTGKMPVTLSFHPALVALGVAIAIAIPVSWIGSVIYSYANKNGQLTQENSQLTEEATVILQRLEDLESEIEHLQERAGLPKTPNAQPQERRAANSQGGGRVLETEEMLAIAQQKLPRISAALQGEVKPALEETLEREDARPRGMPLKNSPRVSSNFGLRRSPFGSSYEFHNGVDFPGSNGTPIHVTAPGVVEKAGWDNGYGNYVVVDHGYGYRTLYAHMSKMAVTEGTKVERDHVIGYVGNTGRSSGPHLHYTIFQDEQVIDPKDYLD